MQQLKFVFLHFYERTDVEESVNKKEIFVEIELNLNPNSGVLFAFDKNGRNRSGWGCSFKNCS
jgi:hypothetical protein